MPGYFPSARGAATKVRIGARFAGISTYSVLMRIGFEDRGGSQRYLSRVLSALPVKIGIDSKKVSHGLFEHMDMSFTL